MVAPSSILYKVSIVLFHKYARENVAVTNCMSHFSMFVPTKSDVKLANGNMGHAQVIGIILCHFTNFPIIYPVVPVYYCPGLPSNTISPGALKWRVGFKKVMYEPLEKIYFVDPQGNSWRSPYRTQNNLDYLQIYIVRFDPQRNRNVVVPIFCVISKQNISQLIHQCSIHVYINRLQIMASKVITKVIPINIPEF